MKLSVHIGFVLAVLVDCSLVKKFRSTKKNKDCCSTARQININLNRLPLLWNKLWKSNIGDN